MNEVQIKKLEGLLEKLTQLYYDSEAIHDTDDNDTCRAISTAESVLINEITFQKANLGLVA